MAEFRSAAQSDGIVFQEEGWEEWVTVEDLHTYNKTALRRALFYIVELQLKRGRVVPSPRRADRFEVEDLEELEDLEEVPC
jgi:hypothetical protein